MNNKAPNPNRAGVTREMRMYLALKKITRFDSVEWLQKNSESAYGMLYEEALKCAYGNVINEARLAVRRMRIPK